MTGGFDPGRYTTAPLQTEGVIRFTGSLDAVFARIANHGALTDWVPMLKTVQVSHPKSLPPGESRIGTTRVLALRGGVTLREEIVYWDPPLRLYNRRKPLADPQLRGVRGSRERSRRW